MNAIPLLQFAPGQAFLYTHKRTIQVFAHGWYGFGVEHIRPNVQRGGAWIPLSSEWAVNLGFVRLYFVRYAQFAVAERAQRYTENHGIV